MNNFDIVPSFRNPLSDSSIEKYRHRKRVQKNRQQVIKEWHKQKIRPYGRGVEVRGELVRDGDNRKKVMRFLTKENRKKGTTVTTKYRPRKGGGKKAIRSALREQFDFGRSPFNW
jgi:hypothetical protein